MSNDIDSFKTKNFFPQLLLKGNTPAQLSPCHYVNGANGQHSYQRYNKNTVYINIILILISFFILIELFDPSHIQTEHAAIILQQHQQFHPSVMTNDNGIRRYNLGSSSTSPISTSSSQSNANRNDSNDRIMSLLNDAGIIISELSGSQQQHLPRWEQVIELFGDNVIIVGKEDCERYRTTVPLQHRQLGVAGMFNTGTNLLDTQLRKNIHLIQDSLWQVPWGKHRMADIKYNHTASDMEQYNKDYILPIVMIRDPMAWLQSMCSSPYAAQWKHGQHHCPNLIPNDIDKMKYQNYIRKHSGNNNSSNNIFEVTVVFDKLSTRQFPSLVHLWSEYYTQYLFVDYPILMIRYEDLVFQPAVVLHEIANCVEGTVQQPIQYQLKSSKEHGSGTDYIKALGKTANATLRSNNMTIEDLQYAAQHLDHRLMNTFHYHVPKY